RYTVASTSASAFGRSADRSSDERSARRFPRADRGRAARARRRRWSAPAPAETTTRPRGARARAAPERLATKENSVQLAWPSELSARSAPAPGLTIRLRLGCVSCYVLPHSQRRVLIFSAPSTMPDGVPGHDFARGVSTSGPRGAAEWAGGWLDDR